MEKKQSKIDLAVLMIFFCRDEQFSKVFEQVKKARPSKLYLYQDGAREGKENDTIGIEKCRKICSDDNIDWECEVHRFYQEKNVGCDPSGYIAHTWLFKNEEMGIVLEDDCVPSQSFFPYCKELLEKYKDDERIAMICGMNNYDVEKSVDSSYFFSARGSIWGWASWRRFVDKWDGKYSWLEDELKIEKIREYCNRNDRKFKAYLETAKKHKNSRREHFESIVVATRALNDMIVIVPKYNMISNIGIGAETTHSVSNIKLIPKKTQKLLYKKTYEIEFPLVHPTEIKRCVKYDKKYKISKFRSLLLKVESFIRKKIIYRKIGK